jgi:DNA-binding NarL/FixJ family response regulator
MTSLSAAISVARALAVHLGELPSSRIVVLTMFENLRYLKALSKLGIDAYVHKSSSSEELVATIDALSRDPGGENVVVSMPRGLLERLGEEPVGTLSERETEIVVLIARGLSNRKIATELNLAPATVKRHLANVYQKIGVRSRSEAVRTALMEQWIGLGEIIMSSGSTRWRIQNAGSGRVGSCSTRQSLPSPSSWPYGSSPARCSTHRNSSG